MSQNEKLIAQILSGKHDKSIRFAELTALMVSLGFSERINGSHHIYYKLDIEEILNLQPDGSKAKSYQVRQVRNLIVKYKLGV